MESKNQPVSQSPAGNEELKERVLTFGEKAVGLSFNPSNLPQVDTTKRKCADLIDELNDQRTKSESPDAKRYLSTAITHLEIAQMLAVKAQTWRY